MCEIDVFNRLFDLRIPFNSKKEMAMCAIGLGLGLLAYYYKNDANICI